jgi:tripartite-type tricarboxylate transporter receptor subunit TctC
MQEKPMQRRQYRARAILAALALAATMAQPASAQNSSGRFTTMVVAFPAGGPTDVLARAVAADLADKLGQQFVVENRSGAGGNVGAASVAKAAADGATLLFATTSVVNNRFMYKNVPFDADRDFAPIVLISKTPIVLVASLATGLKNLRDLIAYAKANPGKLNLGTPGHGTAAHITAELLQRLAGFTLTHVPYRGSAPMIADLLGNQIDVVSDLLPTQIPQLKAGKYVGIAVTGSARSAALPDLATVAENGFPGFEATSWNALLAPTGTSPDVVRKLNAAVNAYLASDKGRQELAKFDMLAGGGSPEDLKAFMAAEVAKWGPIIKAANITIE